MTATEYVALADRAVEEAERRTLLRPGRVGTAQELVVTITGAVDVYLADRADRDEPVNEFTIMRARLTPETLASRMTLKRALLASAVTVIPPPRDFVPVVRPFGIRPVTLFSAKLSDAFEIRATAAEALESLLDALLSEVPS